MIHDVTVNMKTGAVSRVEREPTAEARKALARTQRAKAYAAVADPLFFKWQRGEVDKQEWLDAIADIRTRFPYPGGA